MTNRTRRGRTWDGQTLAIGDCDPLEMGLSEPN